MSEGKPVGGTTSQGQTGKPGDLFARIAVERLNELAILYEGLASNARAVAQAVEARDWREYVVRVGFRADLERRVAEAQEHYMAAASSAAMSTPSSERSHD